MKKPFEVYIGAIEAVLECKFFTWQKKILFQLYSGDFKHTNYIPRGIGISMLDTSAILLYTLIERDEGNLLPYRYELDGYKTNVLLYDENWGRNIEWEKENKLL